MNGNRFSKKIVYFLAISAAAFFLVALLQTSFLPSVSLFGAIPDLVLIFVCGVSFYLGTVDGALAGLVGGILLDALGSVGFMISPIFYTAVGLFMGILSTNAFANKFIHWAIYSVVFCVLKAFYSMFVILLASGDVSFGGALASAVLPEFFGTLLLALVLLAPARWLSGLLRGRMSLKKGKGGLGDP